MTVLIPVSYPSCGHIFIYDFDSFANAKQTNLNEETRHMYNKETFAKMKKNCVFVNTSRGGVVDQDALYDALKNGVIRAAALGTFANFIVDIKIRYLLPLIVLLLLLLRYFHRRF